MIGFGRRSEDGLSEGGPLGLELWRPWCSGRVRRGGGEGVLYLPLFLVFSLVSPAEVAPIRVLFVEVLLAEMSRSRSLALMDIFSSSFSTSYRVLSNRPTKLSISPPSTSSRRDALDGLFVDLGVPRLLPMLRRRSERERLAQSSWEFATSLSGYSTRRLWVGVLLGLGVGTPMRRRTVLTVCAVCLF